ncbi:uncharacterized protein LOC62_04G005733 [Vanrija pseudolonga]|uniref:Uncharacterized protein n=1 Tax=Vanrija pseudolonga TaxID=143232 RepID=A0AAF0Y982_9TREE|nr:hypothetical protein LOC62_04G005733 [Vanrija pseudolonga]
MPPVAVPPAPTPSCDQVGVQIRPDGPEIPFCMKPLKPPSPPPSQVVTTVITPTTVCDAVQYRPDGPEFTHCHSRTLTEIKTL